MSDAPLAIPEPGPRPGQLDLARLKDVDTPTLRAALADVLGLTVRAMAYAAAVWKELAARGEDLTPLRRGIGAYLPAIASGDVLAETVVNFAGRPGLLKKVAALPAAQQRDIADGKLAPPELRTKPNARSGPSSPLLPGQAPRVARPPLAGEPSDAELDAVAAAPAVKPLDMLAAMIGNAGPGDAAELIADCVRGCGPSAGAVAMRLIPLLEQLTRRPERRPLAV